MSVVVKDAGASGLATNGMTAGTALPHPRTIIGKERQCTSQGLAHATIAKGSNLAMVTTQGGLIANKDTGRPDAVMIDSPRPRETDMTL